MCASSTQWTTFFSPSPSGAARLNTAKCLCNK